MTNKVLYRDELIEEEALVIQKYLINQLAESKCFNSNVGYWYHQSKFTNHFVLSSSSAGEREQILKEGLAEFKEKYNELLKYFDLSFLMDDFNADFVFEIKDKVDLTYIYGLSRILNV